MSDIFVVNGFYSAMRDVYTKPDVVLHYYCVEWEASGLSWADFRGKVLGGTDPAIAEEGSLRKTILQKWQELGLKFECDIGFNGLHASASPFEAMAERLNWLQDDVEKDTFAKAMLAAGVDMETLLAWCKDPQVLVAEDKKASIFDTLEDLDSDPCLAKIKEVAKGQGTLADGLPKNQAFVFIKPHAVTDAVKALVEAEFAKQKIAITREGDLTGPVIGEKKLIDNHYYAIAQKASLSKPSELNPPEKGLNEFAEKFGVSWQDAIAKGLVFNAVDACEKTQLDGNGLDKAWATAKKDKANWIKFGGGFTVSKLPVQA